MCSAWAPTAPSITWSPGAGSRLRACPGRGPSRPRSFPRSSRRSPWSTRAPVCWRRCLGHLRRLRRSCCRRYPQPARVNKKETKAPDVQFQGEPIFQTIPTTTVSRAVNTDKDIIKVGDLYYMCFQGVWFTSRSATGPWEVATSVPAEIYKIPASSPAHNVTYVTVLADDDDEWVTFAAVAGYTGMMVAWGCVVWGSGWYYPPYVGYGG